MLSFYFKFLIYSFGLLTAERHFRVTHMIYTIEPTKETIQAPTPDAKIYVETRYKDPPPLPHPVISLHIHFSYISSNSTDDAGRHTYSQYHTSINSDLIETREISPEDLENHPEYCPKDEIDASEGRHDAKKYIDRFRKVSLRKEVHAVVIYEQPPQPPPYSVFRIVTPITLVIFIVVIGFGVLNVKRNQKALKHKSEAKKCLELSKSNLPIGWILRHIDLQNAYHSETQRLKSKVKRLRNKVVNQHIRIRVLTTKKVEHRFKDAFMDNKLKDLAEKVANLDRELRYLKSLHDLAMEIAEPEVAFMRRFEQDMAEAEEKYLEKIRARPSKARSSPLQWWDEQRRDIELAMKYIERKGPGRNWRLNPQTVERLRQKGLLEPGFFNRPAPSQKVLTRRAFIMKG